MAISLPEGRGLSWREGGFIDHGEGPVGGSPGGIGFKHVSQRIEQGNSALHGFRRPLFSMVSQEFMCFRTVFTLVLFEGFAVFSNDCSKVLKVCQGMGV